MSAIATSDNARLNAICPYFTMFPLDFPLGILKRHAKPDAKVLDPFCGRGTTNFAARLLGLQTVGIDASRVAAVTTQAKLVAPTPDEITDAAKEALHSNIEFIEIPEGEFWRLAYHRDVLRELCLIRDALLSGRIKGHIAAALWGIILGGLHGPVGKTKKSYFSNQCPRTYGPKPVYSVKFWKKHKLSPPRVDVLNVISERADRFYKNTTPSITGTAIKGDSRNASILKKAHETMGGKFDWVITSPPYYGLNTYMPDQWIRNWFLGGPTSVDYTSDGQVSHSGYDSFVADLRKVWVNTGMHCNAGAKMVIRFGSLGGRHIESPSKLISESLSETGWRVTNAHHAHNASRGHRQAATFHKSPGAARDEVDVWATWQG